MFVVEIPRFSLNVNNEPDNINNVPDNINNRLNSENNNQDIVNNNLLEQKIDDIENIISLFEPENKTKKKKKK